MMDECYDSISISYKCKFSMKTVLCETNYCEDGINVHGSKFHGNYEIQPIYVNNKPYFKMATLGIWWSNGVWWIGYDTSKGQPEGQAFYIADDYCPHQINDENWAIWTNLGWTTSNLYITCK